MFHLNHTRTPQSKSIPSLMNMLCEFAEEVNERSNDEYDIANMQAETLTAYQNRLIRWVPQQAMILMEESPNFLYLKYTYVRPKFRHKGLCTELVQRARRLAIDKKKKYLSVLVPETHSKGVVFYEKMGFQNCGVYPYSLIEAKMIELRFNIIDSKGFSNADKKED